MNTDPLVTLVVAAYCTQPAHLQAALTSALGQTHRKLEIIVSDDSPDDGLRGLVQSFADARLYYQHNRPALGVAQNHWQGLQQARGSFVAILNHDDAFAPTFVARTLAALRQHPGAALAFCDHRVINVEGQAMRHITDQVSARWGRSTLRAGLHQPFAALVVAQSIPMAMGTLIRHSALPRALPAHAGPAYDLWLCYLLARSGAGAVYLPERLSDWRDHASNLTHAAGLDWLRGSALCWQAMADDPACMHQRPQVRRLAAAAWVACARGAWRLGQRRECSRSALRSLRACVTARGVATLGLGLLPAPARTRLSRAA